jgi:hypothetical protein
MPSDDNGEKTVGTMSMRGNDPLTKIAAASAVLGAVHYEELARMALMPKEKIREIVGYAKDDLGSDVLEGLNEAMADGTIPNDKIGKPVREPLTQLAILLRVLARKDDVRSQLKPGELAKLTDQEAENILFDVFTTMESELRIDLAKHGIDVDPKFDAILPTDEKKELTKESEEAKKLGLSFANSLALAEVWIRSDGTLRGRWVVGKLCFDPKIKKATADYLREIADGIEKGR